MADINVYAHHYGVWKVYRINGLPWRGLSGLTGTLRLKADLPLRLTWRSPGLPGRGGGVVIGRIIRLKTYLTDFLLPDMNFKTSRVKQRLFKLGQVRRHDLLWRLQHLDVICWTHSPRVTVPLGVYVYACACVSARHLTNTVALCTFELPYIVWSGAFISTLVNVSAGKVSSFDALPPPLITHKCHPVVMTEAIPLTPPTDFLRKQEFRQGIRIIWWAWHKGDDTELIS